MSRLASISASAAELVTPSMSLWNSPAVVAAVVALVTAVAALVQAFVANERQRATEVKVNESAAKIDGGLDDAVQKALSAALARAGIAERRK